VSAPGEDAKTTVTYTALYVSTSVVYHVPRSATREEGRNPFPTELQTEHPALTVSKEIECGGTFTLEHW
jgi:hypothetical protein